MNSQNNDQNNSLSIQGRIHSYETGSAVDGPGLRFVVFTQGCPLRCLYCQNPDTRPSDQGTLVTVSEIFNELEKYHDYMDGGHGGITISGGEPLLQPEFVSALLKTCKAAGFHTCIDTSGFGNHNAWDLILPWVDHVLLDIKSWDRILYKKLTHVPLEPTLEFAHQLEQRKIPFWLRFVLVPGLTDNTKNIEGVAQLLKDSTQLQRVEILGFHKLGEYKWKELSKTSSEYNYQLEKYVPPDEMNLNKARDIFKKTFKNL